MAAAEGGPVPFSLRDYLISAGVTVSACIGANFVADAYGEVAAALILVLGIVVTGAIGGLVCALVASAASFLVFNFLIAEPVLTLRLANGRDVTPLVVFSLVGILSGVLAGRLRDRTAAARASNMRLGQLLAFSRALQSATSASDVAATLADVAERTLGVRADLRPANGGQHPAAPSTIFRASPTGRAMRRMRYAWSWREPPAISGDRAPRRFRRQARPEPVRGPGPTGDAGAGSCRASRTSR